MRPCVAIAKCGLLIACAIVVSGCAGGQKLLKEPIPVTREAPLAVGQTEHLAVSLDWVVVPGGPGSWAENARWDQYQVSVQRLVAEPVTVSAVRVVDSMDVPLAPLGDRKALVAATKETGKRYARAGFDVQPGAGLDPVLSVGTGAAAVGAASGAALGSALGGLGASGAAIGAGAAAGAIVVGAPILAVGGIMRASRHQKVNAVIVDRAIVLPIEVALDAPVRLELFMPITPGPQVLELDYQLGTESKTLALPLDDVLGRLHLAGTDQPGDAATQ